MFQCPSIWERGWGGEEGVRLPPSLIFLPILLPAGGPGSQAPSLFSLSLSKTDLGLSFPTLKMREMD